MSFDQIRVPTAAKIPVMIGMLPSSKWAILMEEVRGLLHVQRPR